MRLSRSLIALLALMMIATALPAPARAQAQPQPCPDGTTSGRVEMDGAFATVDYARRTYEIAVQLSGLNHRGVVGYDDDNDGIKERCEPSNGLGGFELDLTVDDPSVIAVESAVAGDNLEGNSGRLFSCFQRHDNASHFAIGCASTGGGDGPQRSRTLAIITLRPAGNGVTNLRLEAALTGPLGDDADVRVNKGGVITVTGAPEPPPGAGSTPAGRTPVSGTPGGGPNGETTAGNPSASGTPNGLETPGGTPDGDQTPEATSADGDGGGQQSQGGGDGGGLSGASVMLWTLAGLGGVGAAGALGLAAMRWRGVL